MSIQPRDARHEAGSDGAPARPILPHGALRAAGSTCGAATGGGRRVDVPWERKESPMSTVLRPAGPEPAQVYWTRRVLVLAGLIVVVALIWSLLSGLGGGNGDAEGTTQDDAAADDVAQETPATDAPAARTCTADDLSLIHI